MASFLYFVSGVTTPVTPALIEQYGLGYAFTGTPENSATNGNSPSGVPGCVFVDSTRQEGRTAGYHPDRQTWRELPAADNRPPLWLGYWTDAKPTPAQLARTELLDGPELLLADGNRWQVPIVRSYDEVSRTYQCELPAYLDYDAAGRPVRGEVIEKHRRLWELTAPIASRHFADGSEGEDGSEAEAEQQLYAAVVALLQANYVVDLPELVQLRAIADEASLATAALVSCRYDVLVRWIDELGAKKNDPTTTSGSSTSAGEAD